jgi:integrase
LFLPLLLLLLLHLSLAFSRAEGVVEVLRGLQERHNQLKLPPDSTLFHSKRDGLIENPRKWFATALEQAGIEGVTWHTLRHTFASRLVMAGVDLKTVQELMGHKTIAMTARCAHLAPTHKLQALETLVRPGSVSVQSGRKLATGAKTATRSRKLNSTQLIEST